ncbi:MAG TPA: RNA ligase family protein [Methanosarcinales archaeon]|nr:RNA ligase family protein [Methanosarcinales archaeon]
MEAYHKIDSIFDRDEKFKFIEGVWRTPEFEFLQNNTWLYTEKVRGTNIRIMCDQKSVCFGGRKAISSVPPLLEDKLTKMFPLERFRSFDSPVCLYGEGYGARIQKSGGLYMADDVSFVLFDVLIGNGLTDPTKKDEIWWLKWPDIEIVAAQIGIKAVPIIGDGTIWDAVKRVKDGIRSTWGDFEAEGLVIRPATALCDRNSKRILGKLKHKDFAE